MKLIVFFILLWTAVAGRRETHSLYYIYTALSRDLGLPGIHNFTAMGLLDNRMIDYFDSKTKEKVPKQPWMKDRLEAEYWVKGTQSRQKKQQLFEVDISILKDRMRQNDSDLHVLQWMIGCEGEMGPDGTMKFSRGMSRYNYDGTDFLSFDNFHSVWVAPVPAAEETKRKWDHDTDLNDKIKGYLENECMQWLNKFWSYGMNQLQTAAPPEVYMLTRDTSVESKILLTCLATSFSFQDIIMWIKRDGRKLYREDGLQSSGVRPNEDGTFQRRDSVEILRQDKSKYTCEVIHEASSVYVTKEWENSDSGLVNARGEGVEGPLVPVSVLVLVLVPVLVIAVVLVVLYRRGIIGCKPKGNQGNPPDVQIPLNGNISNSNNNANPATITAADNTGDQDNTGTNRRPEVDPLKGNKH